MARALGRLRIGPLIAGVRGEPALAIAPYLAAAVALGRLMVEEPEIASLDVNPILVGMEPGDCLALDAVVFVEGGAA
ncbi:hypothetical protein VQ03_30605 [Methylobacterium tarhaniae]|uniref:Uncharacterized protein n=1 Tax=Methylobacterium tarhaniae TaxID=1187852 RepID=A0A0J6S117_9HYPH|nr:hypothetical protein VQ03_30605 [Methylobacterium tarhaniae]